MRIFSIDDFVAGKIPRKEDFRPAIDQFERECVLPYIGTEVYGALLYGSANRDDFTIASDIDYLVVLYDSNSETRIRDAAARALEERNVLIQTRIILFKDAIDGIHGIDKEFLIHLQGSAERYGWRGEHPLEILADDGLTLQQAARMTAIRHSRKVRNGYVSPHTTESEYLTFLKSILEKPWHVLRAALCYKGIEIIDDTKTGLLKTYQESGFDSRLVDSMVKVELIHFAYKTLIQRRQEGNTDLNGVYGEMLRTIELTYTPAMHFIDGNKRLMKPEPK